MYPHGCGAATPRWWLAFVRTATMSSIRRFMNVANDRNDPDEESILMFVIGGNAPRAEFTSAAMSELEAAGVWPPKD